MAKKVDPAQGKKLAQELFTTPLKDVVGPEEAERWCDFTNEVLFEASNLTRYADTLDYVDGGITQLEKRFTPDTATLGDYLGAMAQRLGLPVATIEGMRRLIALPPEKHMKIIMHAVKQTDREAPPEEFVGMSSSLWLFLNSITHLDDIAKKSAIPDPKKIHDGLKALDYLIRDFRSPEMPPDLRLATDTPMEEDIRRAARSLLLRALRDKMMSVTGPGVTARIRLENFPPELSDELKAFDAAYNSSPVAGERMTEREVSDELDAALDRAIPDVVAKMKAHPALLEALLPANEGPANDPSPFQTEAEVLEYVRGKLVAIAQAYGINTPESGGMSRGSKRTDPRQGPNLRFPHNND